jgi:hypothetical protein
MRPGFFSIIFSIIAVLLCSCNLNTKQYADIIFKNGYICTVDSFDTKAEALAIKDDKIIFLGNNDEIGNFIDNRTKVIDLNGKMILPGFIDSHCHAISSFRYFYELNLYGLKTAKDIQEVIKKYLADHPDAEYIKGRGWSNTDFPKTGPDKKVIDEVAKDLPVSFSSEDGHSKWVNSKTLELAGINKSTHNPGGGIIERYPGTKTPSGTLRENAADLVTDIFPVYTVEELMKGLEKYQQMALSYGITTAHDAYLDAGSNETEAFRNLEKAKKLIMRFRASLYIDPEKGNEQLQLLIDERGKNTGELFRTNSAKIFIDGVVEGSTAYLKTPYQHIPGSYGNLLWDPDKLNNICSQLDKNKFQIHVHSIGDAATSVTLDAFEFSRKQNGGRDSRNLITHLQLVDPADIKRFKDLGVIAVPQPYWFIKDDYYYNIQVPYLGKERADKEYPMKSFFDEGVIVASSSDYPVTVPCNPLIAIRYGITRSQSTSDDPGEILWPEERVTLEQMIRSFTINGAYANFLENETGSLEVGKKADLIVLDKNLFKIPVSEISKAKVLMTLFEGKEVFTDSTFNLVK